MSRLHKTVEVSGADGTVLSVTVHELTVGQIIELINDEVLSNEGGKNSLEGVAKYFSRNLDKATTLTIDQAKQMAPSDLKKVYTAFKEVNETFFDVAREAGLLDLLNELRKELVANFSRLLVGSLNRATAAQYSDMDTHSLLTQ